ncbi:MAG: ABC transporter ATP-binding protein [Acidimicrobiales bacterium]
MLNVSDITVQFGGITALDQLSFTTDENQICALIGPNGAGKTTLFNVVSRIYNPTAGSVTFAGRDLLAVAPHNISNLGAYRTFQNLALWPGMSVIDNVMVGEHTQTKSNFVTAMLRTPKVRREERESRARAWEALERLDLTDVAFHSASGLPFGTLKRIELARAMIAQPTLLMLDEPASGLTHSEVDELGNTIRKLRDEYNLTILLVEHHMRMVMGISEKVVVMNFGKKIAEGPPSEVRTNPAVIEAYLGSSAA